MGEKVKGFLSNGKQWWKSAKKKTKILLGAVLLAMVVAIVTIVAVSMNRPYATLFTGLSQTDLTAVVSYLSENGVTDYQISGDDTILVPEDQEAALKAQVLVSVYPTTGYGYSTYLDNVGSLTTESERNQLVLYDLQDRMAAVIRSMDGVKEATVFLTPGEDRTYVLDSGNVVDATAAVHVTMREGKTLTDGQVQAIRSLVSRGLQGLNVENVEITDGYGNNYTLTDDLTQIQDASTLKLKLEEQYNNLIRTRVMQVLLPMYGEDNVWVSVNTVVDLDRTYTDSTDYALEDWAEGNDDGIIGTRVWEDSIVRGTEETVGGTVGTETNADLSTYVEDELEPNGTESVISASGQTNHLVDTTKQQVEHIAGYIADVMVSVSINSTTAGAVNETELYPHVARAAGITEEQQEEKVHILVAPFYQEPVVPIPVPEGVPLWVLLAALGGILFFLLLLTIILLVRRRRRKKQAALLAAQLEQAQAAQAAAFQNLVPEGADIMEMQTEKSMELRQDVRKFAEENPEIAAQMVKAWLREGDSVE